MLGGPQSHPWDCTSRRWLLLQLPQKHRPRTWRLFACSLVGWPARHHLAMGPRWPGMRHWKSTWIGATARAQHKTWPAKRSQQCGGRVLVLPRPMSRSFPSAIACLEGGSAWSRILPPTSAQGARAPGGALACRAPSKTPGSYFRLLFETYMRPSEGLALRGFQLLPPVKEFRESWVGGHCSSERASRGSLVKRASTTPASHWTWHANSSCFPFCGCSKKHEASDSSSFPSRTRTRQRKWKTR